MGYLFEVIFALLKSGDKGVTETFLLFFPSGKYILTNSDKFLKFDENEISHSLC